MALYHLIAKRKTVTIESLRFDIRSPTVATIRAVILLYYPLIQLIRKHWKSEDELPSSIRNSARAAVYDDKAKARAVLETCVDGPLPNLSTGGLDDLVSYLLDICDLERIAAGVTMPDTEGEEESAEPEDSGPSGHSINIVKMARIFGCAPFEIMEWPFEAFLETIDVIDCEAAWFGWLLPEVGSIPAAKGKPVDPAKVAGIGHFNVRQRR